MILFVEKKGTSFFYAPIPENGSVAGKPIPRETYENLSGSGFIQFKKVEDKVDKKRLKRGTRNKA